MRFCEMRNGGKTIVDKNGSGFLNATPHSSSRSRRRGFFFLRAPFYVTFDALVPESYRALRRKSIQPREKKVYRAKRQKLIPRCPTQQRACTLRTA